MSDVAQHDFCEDHDPEECAGQDIEDNWSLEDGHGENYGWPTIVKGGGDGVGTGRVPAEPA